MSHPFPVRAYRRRLLAAAACALLGAPAAADEPARRAPAAKVLSADGSVQAREAPGKPWRLLATGKAADAGDLLLGLPLAAVQSENGAVRLTFLSDLDELSPFPVLESAVTLHPAGKRDLDFTLDRGRIDLVNQKKEGAAKVRVRFAKYHWDLTLARPGTRVALEIYGRWPAGTRFDPNAKVDPSPVTSVLLLVLEGEAGFRCPLCQHALKAPPGPALLQWDSVTGQDVTPQRLDKLPAWAKAPDQAGELAKMKRAKLEKFRKAALAAGSADAAIKEFIDSDDAYERRLGVYAAAALDRLDYVAEVLHRSKHADTWHNAVVALRHWLGRGPGQDRILYDRLVKLRNYKPAQARTVLQLLHGFSEEQTGRPELYQVLIDMLRHDRLAIRGLANWHLQRLAPTVKIAFDPAGDKQERERAYKEWKRAIPTGKLPPEPAPEKKS